MPLSRRHFLATSAASAAGLALSAAAMAALRQPTKPAAKATPPTDPTQHPPTSDEFDDTNIPPASKKLKLLILGGTAFTGPHLVRLALARGHTVTVFNRGRTEKRIGTLPDSVEKLIGDRDPKKGEGLKALEGDREWDAVVDTSGYVPRIARASTELLAKRVKHYTFISSISAYDQPLKPGSDESAKLSELDDPTTEDMGADFHNYGPLKVACEKVVQEVFKGHNAIVRPTFISGPGDPTDRFTYWPVRTSKGGEMACPGSATDPVQYIDVRDLAAFLLHISENGVNGVFNAAGPSPACTMGELLAISKDASKADTKFTWIDTDFMEKCDTQIPPGAFPIYASPKGDEAGMAQVKFDAAVKAGLKIRPVRDTVAATLAWWPREVERRVRVTKEMQAEAEKDGKQLKMPDPTELRAGLNPDTEKQLLAEWHKEKDEKKG